MQSLPSLSAAYTSVYGLLLLASLILFIFLVAWVCEKSRSTRAQSDETEETRSRGELELHYNVLHDNVLHDKDLYEIIRILSRHHFDETKYEELGLALGLHLGTIKVIEKNNTNDTKKCLRECLSKWLRKVDNVKSHGEPTWNSLIMALKAIGENAVADDIQKKKQRLELFLKHKLTLAEDRHSDAAGGFADLNLMARLLLKEDVISEGTFFAICNQESDVAKQQVLIESLSEAVYQSQENFLRIVSIFLMFPKIWGIGQAIQMIKNFKVTDGDIHVPVKLVKELKKRRKNFATMVCEVKNIIEKIEVKKLTEYLQIHTPELKHQISSCENIEDISSLIIDSRCTVLDVTILEDIVDHFKMTDAQKKIQRYVTENEHFCSSTSVKDCLGYVFLTPSPLVCQTATFVVDKDASDWLLKDIKHLVSSTFEDYSNHVSVNVVRESRSFTITCTFPILISEYLIENALQNIDFLTTQGVCKLTVGFCVVFSLEDHCNINEEESGRIAFSACMKSKNALNQLLISSRIQLLEKNEEIASLKKEKQLLSEKLQQQPKSGPRLHKLEQSKKSIKKLQDSYRTSEIIGKLNNAIKRKNETIRCIKKEKINLEKELEKVKREAVQNKYFNGLSCDHDSQYYNEFQQWQMPERNYGDTINHDHDAEPAPLPTSESMQELPVPNGFPLEMHTDGDAKMPCQENDILPDTGYDMNFEQTSVHLIALSTFQCEEAVQKLTADQQIVIIESFSSNSVLAILPNLLKTSTVKEILITRARLNEECFKSLADLLSSNTSLEKLTFNDSGITDKAIRLFADTLVHNLSLTKLSFANNTSITSECVKPLADLILSKPNLVELGLQFLPFAPDAEFTSTFLKTLRDSDLKVIKLDQKFKPMFEGANYQLEIQYV